jgi:hypothetical protein
MGDGGWGIADDIAHGSLKKVCNPALRNLIFQKKWQTAIDRNRYICPQVK